MEAKSNDDFLKDKGETKINSKKNELSILNDKVEIAQIKLAYKNGVLIKIL